MRIFHGIYAAVFLAVLGVCVVAYVAALKLGIGGQRVVLPAILLLTAVAVGSEYAFRWLINGEGRRAEALANEGRFEEAIVGYDGLIDRLATDRAMAQGAAWAMLRKADALDKLGRRQEALALDREIVAQFERDYRPPVRRHVAAALLRSGLILQSVGNLDEALVICDEVDRRFGDSWEAGIRDVVAGALLSRGRLLHDLGRVDEAVANCNELIRRYGDATRVFSQTQLAVALRDRVTWLLELGRRDEALAACDDLAAGFGESSDLQLLNSLAWGLVEAAR